MTFSLSPRLSVVVPAFHEASGIAASLRDLDEVLAATHLTYEVVLVADGDFETYRAAASAGLTHVRVMGYARNRGKGFALRFGTAVARGELVTFLDSDMEINPREIGRMAALLELYEADMVVGSKRHPLSEVFYPPLRRFQSFCYHVLVELLFKVRVRDTQTGLKMMRREVAVEVVALARVSRFAFDLELIALARKLGYGRIIEAPVRVEYRFSTTTNMRAVLRVLIDTVAIYYRLRRTSGSADLRAQQRMPTAPLPDMFTGAE